jgi:mRNA interferase RelE/StbE
MYKLNLLDNAISDLQNLDTYIAKRIVSKLKWLQENIEQISTESLKGEFSHLFKLRVGDYRILYELDYEDELIIIHYIGHRKDVYR